MRAAQPPGGAARTLSGPMSEHLDLADWRRRVAATYDALRTDRARRAGATAGLPRRQGPSLRLPPVLAAARSRRGATSAASPTGATRPSLAFRAALEPDPDAPALDLPRSGAGPAMPYARIGWVSFAVDGTPARLAVYWLNEYAGGIFIPFRDATSGTRDRTAAAATCGTRARVPTSARPATSW